MALLWAVALLTPFVAAHPHSPPANQTRASTFPVRRALANGVALRILPLGDSITYGFGSSDGNGYRQHLRSKLSAGGNAATFVGSQISGSMSNGNNEGHNGATIQQISAFFHSAGGLASRPNVVLLMAGTNDMNRPVEPSTAPDRLDTVISQIVQSAGGDNPVPLIVVAKIPPNSNPSANSRTVTYNAAVEEIVQANQGRGRRVVLADMYSALHVGADMGDGLHPNDGGYAKVADVWYNALADAAERGWIEKPVPAPAGTGRPCTGILSWDPRYGQAASGVGSGDSNKFPTGKWWNRGTVHKGHGENLDGFVHIADLNGDGKDDYIWVDGKSGAAALYLNTGDFANWNAVGRVASGVGAGKGVRFADIDGDGKADYLWIDNVDGVGSVRYGFPFLPSPSLVYMYQSSQLTRLVCQLLPQRRPRRRREVDLVPRRHHLHGRKHHLRRHRRRRAR
jgi:lysophospholipase L1-like esterase